MLKFRFISFKNYQFPGGESIQRFYGIKCFLNILGLEKITIDTSKPWW
jgi:hypothetical protein